MTNGLSDKTGIPGMTRSQPRYFYCRHSAFSQLLYHIGGCGWIFESWDFFFRRIGKDLSFIYSTNLIGSSNQAVQQMNNRTAMNT